MKFSVQERILLQQLLPQKESFLKMLLIDDIIKKTKFTPKEIEKFGIKEVNNGEYLTWTSNTEVEMHLTKDQIDILLSCVKKLDEEGQITLQNLELVKKIYEYANPANQINS